MEVCLVTDLRRESTKNVARFRLTQVHSHWNSDGFYHIRCPTGIKLHQTFVILTVNRVMINYCMGMFICFRLRSPSLYT